MNPGIIPCFKVLFDFFIADTIEKTNLYTGQFAGNSQSDHVYRGAGDMQNSISMALTQAVNKVFQDETVREILLKNGNETIPSI